MRLYLTGFMGAGKTTVGRELAQKLESEFIDLDYEIERSSGRAIESIFESDGEAEFRKRETNTLLKIKNDPAVIATGGGCFIHNQEWMLQNGTVIYLHVPFEILVSRIGAESSRPLWHKARELYDQRQQAYEKAHLQIDASRDIESVTNEIITSLRFLKDQKIQEN